MVTTPPTTTTHDESIPWTSPDEVLSDSAASTWDTPLSDIMVDIPSSTNSSPTDFAFAPPAIPDNIKHSFNNHNSGTVSPAASMSGSFSGSFAIPTGYNNNHGYGYSSASSFSSTTSATGSSFSDALPAISRDFVRPSSNETRRPATAGGALQGGMRFQRLEKDGEGTIAEENVFIDPFSGKDPLPQIPETVDPKYSNRRASESQANAQQWQLNNEISQPPNFSNILHQMQPMANAQRPMSSSNTLRPQTSDGLPTYPGLQQPNNVALPPARTIVGSLDSINQQNNFHNAQPSSYASYRDARSSLPEASSNNFAGDRAYSLGGSVRPSYISNKPVDDPNEPQFVSIGGPAPKKRPRRRYDEIERLYACGWNGCEKSYGTLNHLNAHVAMQKHGEKRLPSEFKDMRKAWRKKKRELAAANANSHFQQASSSWNRNSISSSSESDFDRRQSTASMSTDYSRGSIYSGYAHDSSRPTTSSSIASSDGRPMTQNSTYVSMPFAQPYNIPSQQAITESRRSSAPFHIPMPQQQINGFRQAEGDHPTPTPGNPFPQMQPQSQNRLSFQLSQQQQQHMVQPQQQGFFQTLTAPIGMQNNGHYQPQQFAFQR